MASPTVRPDKPLTRGDGRGVGPTLGEDVGVEAERREIERGVYERRARPEAPPTVEGDGDDEKG